MGQQTTKLAIAIILLVGCLRRRTRPNQARSGHTPSVCTCGSGGGPGTAMTPRAPTIMGSSGGLGVNWTLATLLAALVLSVFVICGVHNKKRHRFKEKGLKQSKA